MANTLKLIILGSCATILASCSEAKKATTTTPAEEDPTTASTTTVVDPSVADSDQDKPATTPTTEVKPAPAKGKT